MRNTHVLMTAVVVMFSYAALADEYDKGLAAYNSADYETALAAWQPLAEAGNADAQFGLGQMYGNGFGVMMDDAAALKWYGLAAAQEHGPALSNLAVMHQNGWGVPMDETTAMQLFERAANVGVADAMVALGRYYAMDFSDSYDPVQAYKWFSLAALLGDFDANSRRESIAAKLTAEQVADGNALVDVWTDSNESMLAQSASD